MQNFNLVNEEGSATGEGVIFSDGSVAVMWNEIEGHAFYNSIYHVAKLKNTKIVFENKEDTSLDDPLIFEIGRVENGWVVRELNRLQTIVCSENSDSEAEAFESFLWSLISNFGPSDSRYGTDRLIACRVPGDKCENANFEFNKVRSKISDHLEYALRFLCNLKDDEKTEEIKDMIETLEKFDTFIYEYK